VLISRHLNLLKWGLRSESPPPERFADESGDVGGQAAVEEFFQAQVFPSDRWQKRGWRDSLSGPVASAEASDRGSRYRRHAIGMSFAYLFAVFGLFRGACWWQNAL